MDLSILNPRRFRGLDREPLEAWLLEVVSDLAPAADTLALRFVDDEEMARLNDTYRHRPSTTDVLSFPGFESVEGRHLGDIVVSVPQARRQAAEAGHDSPTEIRALILHGLLHCLGYDHETDGGEMETVERRLRRRYLGGAR